MAASTIIPKSQDAFAAALVPTLAGMVADRDLNANAMVTLLTIRERTGRRIPQYVITSLHQEWLPRFAWSDFSLPYNTMFTRHACLRNVTDLKTFVADATYVSSSLDWAHRLMLSWILGCDVSLPAHAHCLGDAEPGAAPREALALCLRHGVAPPARAILAQWADRDLTIRSVVDSNIRQRSPWSSAERRRSTGWQSSLVDRRWWQGLQFVKSRLCATVPIRFPRRRPRVAICVSGQLRGYRQAWPTWRRHLFDGIDATIFVHIWTRIGNSDPSPLRASLPFESVAFRSAWRTIGARESLPKMRDRYPRLFSALHSGSIVSGDELMALYGARVARVEDDSLEPFSSWSNQEKMHYKIEACQRLVEDSGDRFDLVVRIRPDLPIRRLAFDWAQLLNRCVDSPVIFTERGYGQQYGHLMIGDQFALGAPDAMAVYCKAWSNAPTLFASGALSTSAPFVGHATLAEVCWLSGLDVRRIPLQFGSLLDLNPLPTNMIRQAIELDAAGRMDEIDRTLLRASRS